MRKKILLVVAAFLITLIISSLAVNAEEFQPPHDMPGPSVDRVIFKQVDQDQAPELIKRGDIDLYLYSLKITTALKYLRAEEIKIYKAPSTMISILMNPAPAPDGRLNPFSIREVRMAVNYLIDRDYISKSIYGGFALPMYTHVSPLDYDYLIISDVLRELDITYDPDYAKTIIDQAMRNAGAELVNGKWTYKGEPIEVKFIIRIEDERREIGNMLAEELEKLGFTVKRIYMDFAQAISIVYKTDPRGFEWHLYTEGWGRGAVERYDYATINQMCAPWLGYMPGWLEYGFWQYRNATLDELGKKIFEGRYRDIEERNRIYAEATKLCVLESVRAWVVVVTNPLPARVDLKGVSTDLVSGLRSFWTLRSAYVEDGELKVGHLWVRPYMGSAWNPVGGFTDVYSVDIWRQLHDPPLLRNPSTGIPMPFRATYEVETAGPTGELKVPEDAFIWSFEKGEWIKVPPGTKARSKVTFDYRKYFGARWHHGVEISMADLLYSIYQAFDMTYNPKKAEIEVALSATRKPILDTFKGFRIVNETAIEVYVDYWNPIDDYIAEYAEPWGAGMPWEILYAMDIMVFEKGEAAYSDTAAARFQVEWLDLINPNQLKKLMRILRSLSEEGRYPEKVFQLPDHDFESLEGALSRYRAAMNWYREHGHLVISNGAFYLERMGSVAEQYAELRAFRDPTYPFKPSDFYVGVPETIRLASPSFIEVTRGVEAVARINLTGPGKLGIRILLIDPYTGAVIYQEEMVARAGTFSITMPSDIMEKLEPGIYQLRLIAYSDLTSLITERIIELSVVEKTLITTTPTIEQTIEMPKPKPWIRGELIIMLIALAAVVIGVALGLILRRTRSRRSG